MARQHIEQSASLDAPDVDFERLHGAGADDFARRVDGERRELRRLRRRQRPEIAIPAQARAKNKQGIQ